MLLKKKNVWVSYLSLRNFFWWFWSRKFWWRKLWWKKLNIESFISQNIRNFCFSGFSSYLLKYKNDYFQKKYGSFLSLGLKRSISWNTIHFFKVSFFNFFEIGMFSPEIFLGLGIESFIFWNLRKTFLGKNITKFLILGSRKFNFPK